MVENKKNRFHFITEKKKKKKKKIGPYMQPNFEDISIVFPFR